VDARAVEADCRILAGRLSYHYCAGFGGGRKLIAPGLCGRDTVTALHRRTLANIDPSGRWRGRTAELDDNPLHEALEAAAGRVGADFALHAAVDCEGRVVGVVAGDLLRSHAVACRQYDQTFGARIDGPQPLVIASCGGWPFDVNLYQAHKSIDMAFRAVAPGGTIVLLAACEEGWGPGSFVRWLAIGTLAEHRDRLAGDFEVAGHTTYALKWKATQCRIVIVSETLLARLAVGDGPAWLTAGAADAPFQLEIADSLDAALAAARAREAIPYILMPAAHLFLPIPIGS
jgi:nickel-dependent lactate racemase